ncbi:MAG: hypothetical protein ACI91Z_000039 [Yoonia sp.]|jgi:hypothetical protein
MLISGGGWIGKPVVFEDRKGVRSTITFAKGLNGYRAAQSPVGQA